MTNGSQVYNSENTKVIYWRDVVDKILQKCVDNGDEDNYYKFYSIFTKWGFQEVEIQKGRRI